MRRRSFVAALAGAAAWPLAGRAQQPDGKRLVGVLMSIGQDDKEGQARVVAFQEKLAELGWAEGRNVHLEYRWAAADADRLRSYAAELVRLAPEVILTNGTPAAVTLRQATSMIPVVFVNVVDPIGSKLAASFASPGGNFTGFTNYEPSMGGKWLETLKEIAPNIRRVLVILNPDNPGAARLLDAIKTAALAFGVDVARAGVRHAADIRRSIDDFASGPSSALIVLPDLIASANYELIVGLAAEHQLPAVYPFRFFVANGGLVAYALDLLDVYRRAASYVDAILKGAQPSGLPIQQPTKFELVINLKTANALSLTIPPTLLARADEVIE